MIRRTDLSATMIALANSGHPRAKGLRDKADAFGANHGIFFDLPTHTRAQLMDRSEVPAACSNCAAAGWRSRP